MRSFQANRGASLEVVIIAAGEWYQARGADIGFDKVPTEWKPLRGRDGKIVSAKVEKEATVDFMGCWRGRGIAFDAKENVSQRNLRLSSVKPHQAAYLDHYQDHCQGIAFLIVEDHNRLLRMVPWRMYQEARQAAGVRGGSIKEEQLATCPVIRPAGGCPLDIRPALEHIFLPTMLPTGHTGG